MEVLPCPKNYNPLYHIKAREQYSEIIIFISFILMIYKFYYLYYQGFDNIKSLLKKHKIE